MLDTEGLVDLQRRVRLVKRVKVNPIHAMIEQITRLLSRPMHPNLPDRLVGAVRPPHHTQQRGRESHAQCQLGHPFHPRDGLYRHDTRDDRHPDPRHLAPITKVIQIPVIEKHLRNDVIRPSIDLRLEIIHFRETIRRPRVPLRESCHPDREPAKPVRPALLILDLTDELHQFRRVREPII